MQKLLIEHFFFVSLVFHFSCIAWCEQESDWRWAYKWIFALFNQQQRLTHLEFRPIIVQFSDHYEQWTTNNVWIIKNYNFCNLINLIHNANAMHNGIINVEKKCFFISFHTFHFAIISVSLQCNLPHITETLVWEWVKYWAPELKKFMQRKFTFEFSMVWADVLYIRFFLFQFVVFGSVVRFLLLAFVQFPSLLCFAFIFLYVVTKLNFRFSNVNVI